MKQSDDQKYLLCDIDVNSVLYEPIEGLRKLLLNESDSEEEDEVTGLGKKKVKERR